MGSSRLIVTIAVVLLAGCASQSQYIQPDTSKKKNSTPTVNTESGGFVVEKPVATVWQRLIAGGPKIGFIIDNSNSTGRSLQLHYTGDPKDYIDCGRVVATVKTAKGERTYDFPAAKPYQQYQLQQNGKLFLVDRRMNLDVRAQVDLEAPSQFRTRISMDVQFTAIRDQTVQGGGSKPFGITDQISFSSAGSATFPNAATKCRATGKFEQDVLALIKQ